MQGDLAEKWTVSPDGKTITFNLVKGVKWHDGKPFTADDVVYSLDKMVDPKRSSLSGNFPAYEKSERVDDNTVRVILKSPSPGFLSQLCSPYASIQPKHKADVDWKTTDFLVGTGPFKFKSYTSGVSGTLVKNPDYFKKDAAGRQLPYLDALELIVVGDRNAQIDGFNTKQLDMCAPYGGFYSQEHWDRIKQQNPTATIATAYPPQVTYFWLNMNSANLKDQRVRKAIALLVDQVQLTTAGYGSPEWNAPGRAVFTPTYGLTGDEQNKLLGRDKPYEARVTEAKQLMKDAGFEKGFQIQLVGSKIAEYERQYTYFADLLKRHLNIDATLDLRLSAEARVLRDQGKFDIWLEEMLGSTGDPDEVWGYLGTGKPGNIVKYSNPKVDELWQKQSQALNLTDRVKITQEIERMILTDLPVIPQRGSIMRTAWQSYVKGFNSPNCTYGVQMTFETTWLDK